MNDKFQYALSCYRKGLFSQADTICIEIREDDPAHSEALHLREIMKRSLHRLPLDSTWKEPPANPYAGEMLPYERYKLFNWIVKIDSKIVLEIGTGAGGGSTFYLSEALLAANNSGKLYTCDPHADPPFIIFSQKRYKDTVFCHKIQSGIFIKYMIIEDKIPDFLFFDGPEIPELALNDFKMLEPHLKKGCFFSMHDFHTGSKRRYDNGISVKSALIKPYLESHNKWRCLEELSGLVKNSDYDDMPFDSVGLCLYEKIK